MWQNNKYIPPIKPCPNFSPQPIADLAKVVTGGSANDSTPPIGHCRSGPKLERFFRGPNIDLTIGSSSRHPTVLARLTLLALAEVGKGNIAEAHGIHGIIEENADKKKWLEDKSEDHFFKLFWVLWTSGPHKMTVQNFKDAQKLAREVHNKKK